MSYQPLPTETVALVDLASDLEDYRIPVKSPDENTALNYLYAEESVYETARMTLRDGYFDNEVPIAVRDQDQHIVLEGSRSVRALQVLQDPTLIPDHEAAIRSLLKRHETEAQQLPTRIRVLVAPTRNAAARHIAHLHTGLPKKRWSLDQQATFYYSLLGPTVTVEDVRQMYPGVNVPRFIRMAVMRRLLTGVKFKDRSLHVYVTGGTSGGELKMSVFEYAYKNAAIVAAMGVRFAADGQLLQVGTDPVKIGAALADNHRAAIELITTQFRAETLNTRSEAFRTVTDAHSALVAQLTGDTAAEPPAASRTPHARTDGRRCDAQARWSRSCDDTV